MKTLKEHLVLAACGLPTILAAASAWAAMPDWRGLAIGMVAVASGTVVAVRVVERSQRADEARRQPE